MSKSLKQTIVDMLTTNTGRHMLDSGDYYGRNYERHQCKAMHDFENAPSATLEVRIREYNGKPEADLCVSVDVFHLLTQTLELDCLCREFNEMPCADWDGDYYGTSRAQSDWLDSMGFVPKSEAFNTYNWNSDHSQVLQGEMLDMDGDTYYLLQIHGGCDVRGGYTDAKLFKVRDQCAEHAPLATDCGFYTTDPDGEELTLDWMGEWINQDGGSADPEYLLRFAEAIGEGKHPGQVFIAS